MCKDVLKGYLSDNKYLGATIGRYANRISNASFVMGGKSYFSGCNRFFQRCQGVMIPILKVTIGKKPLSTGSLYRIKSTCEINHKCFIFNESG